MKSLKVKLVSVVSAFILALSLLIIGVWAVGEAQHINLSGSVNFTISNDTLYIKDIRIRDANDLTGQGSTIENFIPGFVNGDFDLDLGERTADTSFTLLFDVINTTETTYQASTDSKILNASLSVSGIINGDGIEPSAISSSTEPSGTIVLTVIVSSAGLVSLDGVVINIEEYVAPALQVTNVQINDTTPDTTAEFNGGKFLSDTIDLSNITFEPGETTLVVSMTSLNANYIKNKVSWMNTSGVTISSTSLYLPKNPSGKLTDGESKNLIITVNNTGSATTISGLEVEFEDMGENLLQVTDEGETSTYTKEGYWYVEMGTFSTTTDNSEGKRESEYLRWRYFSNTTSHYEFGRNTRPAGEGYFILESYYSGYESTDVGGLYCSWNNDYTYRSSTDATHNNNGWTNIDANDYSTSNIRQYINSEELVRKSYSGSWNTTITPSGTQSNMFTDLHIDPDNDIEYERIIGRTLGDLYTKMGWEGSSSSPTFNNVDFPDLTGAEEGYRYQKTDSDKFWLLSQYEAYNLLGDSSQKMGSSSADRSWGDWYWLRSPYSSNATYASNARGDGYLTGYSVYSDNDLTARAAFKFSVDEG